MLRTLISLLLVSIALAPLALHLTVLAPTLVYSGHRDWAALSFVGSMVWITVFVRAVATPRSRA